MRVLLLDLDTLRPDHLGCYGYHRNTSPNIDRIAREGVRFTNHYCSDAPCLPSRASWITGQFGIHTGVVGHAGTAADLRIDGEQRGFCDFLRGGQAFTNIFRKAGFHTASISPFSERHSAWWFNAGFNEVHNTGHWGMESAEEVTPVVEDWLDKHAHEENWYLHVNYWDPHTPYRAPESFGNPFADQPLPDWITEDVFKTHLNHVGPHSAHEINMYDDATHPQYPRHPGALHSMDDLRRMMDGYDCGVRYMDTHIGMLLARLEKLGVLDDTAIVIMGDHGENMGELGIYGEHGTADHATCNIPLIIRWPGGQSGKVDSNFHYNLDLAPTFADLLDQKHHPRWDGLSFAGVITGTSYTKREELIIGQCAHVCQRSVRFGPWLYIRTYHDGYHLFPKEMLFNLDEDPYEQNDLAATHPEVCREAVWRLLSWQDDMMKSMPAGHATDPLWTVMQEGGPFHAKGFLPDYCKRLESTGRGEAVPELMRRHPGEFK